MSINLERKKIQEALLAESINSTELLKLVGIGRGSALDGSVETIDAYADFGGACSYIACGGVGIGGGYFQIRRTLNSDYYYAEIGVGRPTTDVSLCKYVSGENTVLGVEAIDLVADSPYRVGLFATGTTIKLARGVEWGAEEWAVIPNVSPPSEHIRINVTDTAIASGKLSAGSTQARYLPSDYSGPQSYWFAGWTVLGSGIIKPSATEVPNPIAYFEMPIVGTGKLPTDPSGNPRAVGLEEELENPGLVDPYRVELPQEIVEKPVKVSKVVQNKVSVLRKKDWSEEEIKAFMPEAFPVERVNRLALNNSVLIPTDKGKPMDYVAVVRVWLNSDVERRPIEKRIQTLKQMKGVKQLTNEEAVDLALQKDDKLHIHDLMPCKTHDVGGKCFKEYVDWREKSIGEKPEFADTDKRKHYVKETKGW